MHYIMRKVVNSMNQIFSTKPQRPILIFYTNRKSDIDTSPNMLLHAVVNLILNVLQDASSIMNLLLAAYVISNIVAGCKVLKLILVVLCYIWELLRNLVVIVHCIIVRKVAMCLILVDFPQLHSGIAVSISGKEHPLQY